MGHGLFSAAFFGSNGDDTIGQIGRERIGSVVPSERLDYVRTWFGKHPRQVAFAGHLDRERELLHRWRELRGYSQFIAASVDSIPTIFLEPHGVETVQRIRGTDAID